MYGNHQRSPRGGGGPHRGSGGRPRGGMRIKLIQPALLILLQNGPLHGYALMDKLVDDFSIAVMNPNQVYRALRALEGQGAIVSDWDEDESQGPPRRVYELTTEGKEQLLFEVRQLEETRTVIDRVLEEHQKSA